MRRRDFLVILPLFLCACAGREIAEPEEPDSDEIAFRRWLKKRHRWREFRDLPEAREAWKKEVEEKARKKEWDAYRKEAGIS